MILNFYFYLVALKGYGAACTYDAQCDYYNTGASLTCQNNTCSCDKHGFYYAPGAYCGIF